MKYDWAVIIGLGLLFLATSVYIIIDMILTAIFGWSGRNFWGGIIAIILLWLIGGITLGVGAYLKTLRKLRL